MKSFTKNSAVFNAEWANFIVAMRQNGPLGDEESEGGGLPGTLDLDQPASYSFDQVLDLVDARVEVTYVDADEPVVYGVSISNADLGPRFSVATAERYDRCKRYNPKDESNINQCTRSMLLGIPGMDEATADEIISRRDIVYDGSDPNRGLEAKLDLGGTNRRP